MHKAILLSALSFLLSLSLRSQPAATYTFYPPSNDKPSWQRLNLWLSSTYLFVGKEALADQDSCLILAARSLGLSRFSVLAEGFGDEQLARQAGWIDRADAATGVRLLSGTTGHQRLQQLLLLGAYYAFQPASYDRYKDSTAHYLHQAIATSRTQKEDKLRRIALCLLAKVYLQGNDKRGDSICTVLLKECGQSGDQETAARVIAFRGMYTVPTPTSFERKINDLQDAATRYLQLGNTEGAINMLTDRGYLLIVMGALEEAYDIFRKALSLCEAIHYPYIHYNSETMVMVTFFQGKFGEPLRYLRQTIRVAEACRDSLAWGYFYGRMSLLMTAEGRSSASTTMARKAIDRFIIDRNPSAYLMLNNLVLELGESGRVQEALALVKTVTERVGLPTAVADQFFYKLILANCELYLHRPDAAERYLPALDSLETVMEAVRGPFRRNSIHELQAQIYFARGQYQKAREYAALHFTAPTTADRGLMNDVANYRFMIQIDSALDDKPAMVAHYRQYARLLDSNFQVTKIRQAEELQVVYETQEKENQITALNKQAKQSRLIRNLTLAGIAAVLIIAVLLYRQSRLRKKSNQLITDKNGQLQDLLADKDWLLKEIHHRVKNNLEIIMSLLNSQSKYIDNDAALNAINDSQRRVHAISLIHQKLYQTANSASIDMRQYIDELISYLQESFDTGSRAVIEQDIDPVWLDVAQAIPLSLILNEGIVNAVKYAFPGTRQGIIRVSLKQTDDHHLLLEIADNGTGLPEAININKSDSLGFSLMHGLTRQLEGSLRMENRQGLHITIRFNPQTNHGNEQE
ncbi:sensor histidine kinase [Paraflavitalea pollutisoli]|uniref:sensor histidine kinase n=1 Tax=Paraflavitalea pollutisoli TaxID=3034143 RepID=UPI0023EBB150|nr:sensor histidine kinase [Paraflavitalea sp. H1-2-19X]